MKILDKKTPMKFVYFIVFFSLALWAFFAYYTMMQLIDEQKIYAKLINISGKQRMLSQKSALIAKRFFETKDSGLKRHFKELKELMASDHNFLISNLSKNMKRVYFEEPNLVDKRVKEYLLLLEEFYKDPSKRALRKIESDSFKLLPTLNYTVYEFEKEIASLVDSLQKRELIIFISTVITLLLEAFFIVFPAIRAKEEKERELVALNSSLEVKVKEGIKLARKKDEIILHQSKMSAMGEMLDNISHQWRKPLSIITTVTTGLQLKREYDNLSDDELNKDLNTILHNTNYLSSTIEIFRDYLKKEKDRTVFSIKDAYYDAMKMIEVRLQNNDIVVDAKIDDIKVIGRKVELTQVFIDILDNSKDALLKVKNSNRFIKVTANKESNNIKIVIKDNGGGVSDSKKDELFEPYYTTKSKREGIGLGLYLAKQIVEKNFRGQILIENDSFLIDGEGYVGAKVTINLPDLDLNDTLECS